MDRNQRSRRQKSVSGSYSQAPKRSMGSRMAVSYTHLTLPTKA